MITKRRWESGESPGEMIRSATCWVKNPERKARLYRVALVRRVWGELPWVSRVLTELAERKADKDFDEACMPRSLEYMAEEILYVAQWWKDGPDEGFPNYGFSVYDRDLAAIGYTKPPNAGHTEPVDRTRFCELMRLAYRVHFEWCGPADLSAGRGFDSVPLVREIFGNPFRPVALDPSWLTSDVRALARGIYDENAFDRMPILADALQDAGCDSADVLDHCRSPESHVRGCWVLDLLLEK